jgi:prolipoprotein diacylglyceryltransferase
MSEVIDFITLRGEYVSLFLIAGVLAFVGSRVARLTRLPRSDVGDLFWNAGIAFVLVGRIGYLALEAPASLTDPLVLIRLQGGLAPLLGVLAAITVVAWRTRAERGLSEARLAWLAVAAAGLVTATWTYDVACFARDACYGTTAPAPLGFVMSNLSDTRMATPLIEATLLLFAAGALLSSKLSIAQSLLALGAVGALLRAALTAASVRGADAIGVETAGFVALGLLLLALAATRLPDAAEIEAAER